MTENELIEGSQSQVNEHRPASSTSNVIVSPSTSSGIGNEAIESQQNDDTNDTTYLKWIQWNSGKIPIVMQSKNGPCPLIAIINVLLLREKVKLPDVLEQITSNQLLTYLGECIMDYSPVSHSQNNENDILNLEQNIHDAMEILPKLKTGLDVNIRFTGINDFEYTPECIIFDLLRIPLYHGWLVDPDLIEVKNAIGCQSYNQLVDNIITNKTSSEPETQTKVIIAEEFLERTASQLTMHGLIELRSKIKENEIAILFRNNHFLTLFKRDEELYTLVTDHGYLTEDNIVWETLDNIEGAGRFFDSNFQLSEVTNRQVSEFNLIDKRTSISKQQQYDNDYLMALSLRVDNVIEQGKEGEELLAALEATTLSCQTTENDYELAKRLQAEEEQELLREQTSSNSNKQVDNYYYKSSRADNSSLSNESSEKVSSNEATPKRNIDEHGKEVECSQKEISRSASTSQCEQQHQQALSLDHPPTSQDLNIVNQQQLQQREPNQQSSTIATNRNVRTTKSHKDSHCIVN